MANDQGQAKPAQQQQNNSVNAAQSASSLAGSGLSKREEFAMHIAAAYIVRGIPTEKPDQFARRVLGLTDGLLAELTK